MKKTISILLFLTASFVFASTTFAESSNSIDNIDWTMNPDGYIHGFTLTAAGHLMPGQMWTNDYSSRYFSNDGGSVPDESYTQNTRHNDGGYGFNLGVKFPLSRAMTIGFSYTTDTVLSEAHETFTKTYIYPNSAVSPSVLSGSTDFNTNHQAYTVGFYANYYFKPLW